MREETRKIYITDDGKEFLTKQEATEHEVRTRILEMFTNLVVSPSGYENHEARVAATDIVMQNIPTLRMIFHNAYGQVSS